MLSLIRYYLAKIVCCKIITLLGLRSDCLTVKHTHKKQRISFRGSHL